MSVRLDDRLAELPEVMAAGPLGLALYVAGLLYAKRAKTNIVPAEVAASLLSWKLVELPLLVGGGPVASDQVIAALVSTGLWREVEGGYAIRRVRRSYAVTDAVREQRRAARRAPRGGRLPAVILHEPSVVVGGPDAVALALWIEQKTGRPFYLQGRVGETVRALYRSHGYARCLWAFEEAVEQAGKPLHDAAQIVYAAKRLLEPIPSVGRRRREDGMLRSVSDYDAAVEVG